MASSELEAAARRFADEVERELTCRCDEAYTARGRHEPNAFCGYFDDEIAAVRAALGEPGGALCETCGGRIEDCADFDGQPNCIVSYGWGNTDYHPFKAAAGGNEPPCIDCHHPFHGEDRCEVTISYGAGDPGACGCRTVAAEARGDEPPQDAALEAAWSRYDYLIEHGRFGKTIEKARGVVEWAARAVVAPPPTTKEQA